MFTELIAPEWVREQLSKVYPEMWEELVGFKVEVHYNRYSNSDELPDGPALEFKYGDIQKLFEKEHPMLYEALNEVELGKTLDGSEFVENVHNAILNDSTIIKPDVGFCISSNLSGLYTLLWLIYKKGWDKIQNEAKITTQLQNGLEEFKRTSVNYAIKDFVIKRDTLQGKIFSGPFTDILEDTILDFVEKEYKDKYTFPRMIVKFYIDTNEDIVYVKNFMNKNNETSKDVIKVKIDELGNYVSSNIETKVNNTIASIIEDERSRMRRKVLNNSVSGSWGSLQN